MRLATPERLIDLNRVGELAYVRIRDGGLAIGAMTRQRAVERSALAAQHVPLVADALPWVGHFQIRNRGTIGGSLSHADPAAELPAVALCLDARLTARGPAGERTIAAADFFLSQLTTALAPTELLTEVWFPSAPPGSGSAWLELARRHGDYALVGVAAVVTLVGDRIGEARLALTGVGDRPVRAREAEARLARRAPHADRARGCRRGGPARDRPRRRHPRDRGVSSPRRGGADRARAPARGGAREGGRACLTPPRSRCACGSTGASTWSPWRRVSCSPTFSVTAWV